MTIDLPAAKILCLILNNIINIQVYYAKCVFVVNLPKFATTKVSIVTSIHFAGIGIGKTAGVKITISHQLN